MQCEICGRYIERGKRVRLEGSVVIACDKCADYGEVVSDVRPYAPPKLHKEPVKEAFEIETKKELVEDYSKIIREAREKKEMKQEDLAKKINQPKSLIHRIESGKFEPNENLARKIEKVLGTTLLKEVGENIKVERKLREDEAPTLGDLVVIRKKKK